MKKFIIIAFLFFIFLNVYGQVVPVETARQVAKNIYFERASQVKPINYQNIAFASEIAVTEQGSPLYYIFNVENHQGFVIISAERQTMPILFYTFEGSYSEENLPPAFVYMLEQMKAQIKTTRAEKTSGNKTISEYWNYYSTQTTPQVKEIAAVAPLLGNITWDQGCYYNQLCPTHSAGPCGKVYAGCVATAMAMVMKKFNYPTTGYGSHSYSHTTTNGYPYNFGTLTANFGATTYAWSSMPDKLTSTSTTAQKTAVATIIYHAGVSVEMSYSPYGSGAYLMDAETAFEQYFIYAADYTQRQLHSDAAWATLLKNSLDSGWPVIYGGQDNSYGGHAWVCDGYQNSGTYTDMFHMNWGWNGASNGYFLLSNLSAGGYSFNSGHEMVYNIHPNPAQVPIADFTASPTTIPINNVVLFTSTSQNNPLEYLWTITPSAGTSYITGSATTSSNRVRFTIPGYYTISLKVTNSAGTDTETKPNFIYVYSTADMQEIDLSRNILIYPNPAKNYITIETGVIPCTDINIVLFDVLGNKIHEEIYPVYEEKNKLTLDLQGLTKGVYYINIQSKGQQTTKKIVVTG